MSQVDKDEAETGLVDLQRKYRIMESNRKNYSEDTQSVIKKQRETIDKIKSENDTLKKEVQLAKGDSSLTPQLQRVMMSHQDHADAFTRKIELERRRLDELEKAIALADSKIINARTTMGGVNAAKEDEHQAQKQIRVLESRLDKALTKFNEALANNKELREEIDNLRRERAAFDEIYGRMQKELHDKKKDIANVIEISNIAYEARDQAQNEVAALRAQADKEVLAWNAEVDEVQKQIEREKKTNEDMRALSRVGGMTMDEENRLKGRVLQGKWGAGKSMALVDATSTKALNYDELVAKIQAATGITEMDELVMSFTKAEDKNYSLFNFANELNQDIERLEEVVTNLEQEEKRLGGEDQSSDSMRQTKILELEHKLSTIEVKANSFREKFASGQKTMNALKAGITSIFSKLGCDNQHNRAVLDMGEGVTDANVVQVLGIIEARGNEVMQLYAKSLSQLPPPETSDEPTTEHTSFLSGNILGPGPQVPSGGAAVQVNPPTTTDDQFSDDNDSDDEFDDRPLTRNELEAKTMRNISKRDSRGARRQRRK